MNDYSECKIYKISSISRPDLVYYGHTIDKLENRNYEHKLKSNKCASYQITKLEDSYIELIEDYPCSSLKEAKDREAYYIINNQCINEYIPNKCFASKRSGGITHTRSW